LYIATFNGVCAWGFRPGVAPPTALKPGVSPLTTTLRVRLRRLPERHAFGDHHQSWCGKRRNALSMVLLLALLYRVLFLKITLYEVKYMEKGSFCMYSECGKIPSFAFKDHSNIWFSMQKASYCL